MTEYLTDEGLKFLIPRYFKNKSELLDEAVKLILRSNQAIRVELAVTTPEFKEILAEKGYKRVVEGDSIDSLQHI